MLPAGQVEIVTTGHMEDFEDATLILREDIESINNLILVNTILSIYLLSLSSSPSLSSIQYYNLKITYIFFEKHHFWVSYFKLSLIKNYLIIKASTLWSQEMMNQLNRNSDIDYEINPFVLEISENNISSLMDIYTQHMWEHVCAVYTRTHILIHSTYTAYTPHTSHRYLHPFR